MICYFIRKITFSDVRFGLNVSKTLLGSTKNMDIINKLNTATDIVDKINRVLPNHSTEDLANKINNSGKERTWRGFTATVSKDKHGKGNNGLVLGYKDENTHLEYNRSTGGFHGALGFEFY